MSQPDELRGVVAPRRELIELGRCVPSGPLPGRGRVATRLAGGHASRLVGTGLEFSEVRAYQPGDDVRAIDWRVTARTGRVHSKLFELELERPAWFAVDLGASMRFATRGVFKSVAAARAASLLAWRAHRAGERVGGVVTSPGASVELPPGRTRSQLLRFLSALAAASQPRAAPDLAAAASGESGRLRSELRWMHGRVRTGSQVVVVSDFYDLGDEMLGVLRVLARRAELQLIQIYDALEAEAPPPGRYRVSDGRRLATLVARRQGAWRQTYRAAFTERSERLRELARASGARLIPLRTDAPATDLLAAERRAPCRRAAP